MIMRFCLFAWVLLLTSSQAVAQARVMSPKADAVSVSIYRETERSAGGSIDLDSLEGFALISETRRIRLPAGASTLYFEGVADGIIPVSAIVTGLPGGVIQKNRDARLLSPAALVDGSYGRIIHLRRTDRRTGKVTEEDARIISGPQGGVIIKTARGYEALGCAGLPESLVYAERPPTLSARPTLSVDTFSPTAMDVTVQLSYLATGFDWSADYIARVAPDGKTLSLFSWLTLANGNNESFPDAQTQVVAGSVNRVEDDGDAGEDSPAPSGPLQLQCWPLDITSTHPRREGQNVNVMNDAYKSGGYASDGAIVVTAQRRSENLQSVPVAVTAMSAEQVELGDLKAYRIPEPVTVAARGQKQVAMLERQNVPFERIFQARIDSDGQTNEFAPTQHLLRMKNVKERGLGLPLPSGTVSVFQPANNATLLLGLAPMRDTPVGGEVELELNESPHVVYMLVHISNTRSTLTVRNANPYPVIVEVVFEDLEGETLEAPSKKLRTRNGMPMWQVKIGANKSASLSYDR